MFILKTLLIRKKKKMSNRTQVFIDVVFILVLTILGHYTVNQTHQLEMSQQRNAINEDQIQDLMGQLMNKSQTNDLELAKNQGMLEGILTIKDSETKKAYMDVWHAGYYNGVEQKTNNRIVAE